MTKPEQITLDHPNGTSIEVPTGLFINNEFVASSAGTQFATVDANTNKVICHVQEAGADDVNSAVAAASKAFPQWQSTPSADRGSLLTRLANLIHQNRVELALVEALDTGKLVKQAQEDIDSSIADLKFFASCSDKNDGSMKEIKNDTLVYTKKEPFGVVGLIVPWNYPFYLAVYKMAPAVATGNTVVIKTSEKTPLSTLKLCQLIVEAGFPPGVVNVLSGYGTAGDALARHS
ncbi:UNVERIFIED_CONTAM: aldehyde dehydrogenase (NAD(P)(+)) ald5 [Siphonaria sp. JEL0065]|nr:aldehyde dehydrogenase (NAD(P)(+)) ald5 [Siphonaria sp. JEL0065]